MQRRNLLTGVLASSVLASLSPAALAVGVCPGGGRRLRWISPYPVGGEILSRAFVPFLEEQLGSEIVVEVVAGAGGIKGSTMIHEAPPDGGTMGIIYGALDLFRHELAGSRVPHPARDYTILGRIHANRHVWATGADSPFRSIQELIEYGRTRPILVATNSPGGSDFGTVTVTCDLLGIEARWLTGYRGMDFTLAVARGEADLLSIHGATLLPMFEAGDLRPLLQIGSVPAASAPALQDVPLLGGPGGVAAQRARELGRDPAAAVQTVDDLADIVAAGRMVAGPPGIPAEPRDCLAGAVYAALRDPRFEERARTVGLILDVADAETAAANMHRATRKIHTFLPMLREALQATGHQARG